MIADDYPSLKVYDAVSLDDTEIIKEIISHFNFFLARSTSSLLEPDWLLILRAKEVIRATQRTLRIQPLLIIFIVVMTRIRGG